MALFWGPSGVGKTMASEAVGYETGRPVTVISCAEVLARGSMQTKDRMHTLFRVRRRSGHGWQRARPLARGATLSSPMLARGC